jgi:hypothetical protein
MTASPPYAGKAEKGVRRGADNVHADPGEGRAASQTHGPRRTTGSVTHQPCQPSPRHVHTAANAATREESVVATLLGKKGRKRRLVALFTVSDSTSGAACPRNLRLEALSPS